MEKSLDKSSLIQVLELMLSLHTVICRFIEIRYLGYWKSQALERVTQKYPLTSKPCFISQLLYHCRKLRSLNLVGLELIPWLWLRSATSQFEVQFESFWFGVILTYTKDSIPNRAVSVFSLDRQVNKKGRFQVFNKRKNQMFYDPALNPFNRIL